MMNQHAKSPCCHASVRRYGKRRRQCVRCRKTWRVRQKKRGRKRVRPNRSLLWKILGGSVSIRAAAQRQNRDRSVVGKRIRAMQQSFACNHAHDELPAGPLILLIDALWVYFRKEGRFTLYLMALRSIQGTAAYFLNPVLLPGGECLDDWEQAIATIPSDVRKRICAMVSDGLRGLKRIANEHGWKFQRCHFHLIAWLVRRKGQYTQRGSSKWVREALLGYVRAMIETTDVQTLQEFQKEILMIARHADCPRYVRMQVNEFLRTADDFRTYLRYPEFHLPTTTNTVETMIRLLRALLSRTHGLSTPESLLRWTTSYIRFKKSLVCNGKRSTILLP